MKRAFLALFFVGVLPMFGQKTVAGVVARAQQMLDASFADADEAIIAPIISLTPDTLNAPRVQIWTSKSHAEIAGVARYFRILAYPGQKLIEGGDGRSIVYGVFCRCDGQLWMLLKKRGVIIRSLVIYHGRSVESAGLPSTGPMPVDPGTLAPFYRPLMKLTEEWSAKRRAAALRPAPTADKRDGRSAEHE